MKPPAACRFVANDQPRMLRTHVKDCNTSGCSGCVPCGERHCAMPHCGGQHLKPTENQACAKCVGKVRSDIGIIMSLCASEVIVEELLERGPRSPAAWLLGPTADVATWYALEEKAERAAAENVGTLAKGWLADNQHEDHPAWRLGQWDLFVRDHYGHPTAQRVTVARAGRYLTSLLTELARDPDVRFELLSAHMHEVRTMLELALPLANGPQTGAPCPTCRRPLVKVFDAKDTSGAGDRWKCKPCGTSRTVEEYDKYVERQNLEHADKLTASQVKAQYGIPEGTVRRWGLATPDGPAVVRKRGKNDQGLQLYDVADVKAQIDRRTTKETA